MKQNLILKEKLKQSEELIAKLLGASAEVNEELEEEEEGDEEDD